MKLDKIITAVPMLIDGEYYNAVLSTDGDTCYKCAFRDIDVACPVVYMEIGQSPQSIIEDGKIEGEPEFDSERGFPMCNYFGETLPVYFAKVDD